MKTGILIAARLGSSRLPKKHLQHAGGRPIFYYLLERINREFKEEIAKGEVEVVICSSDEPMNEELRQFDNADLFLGDVHNIPKRQVQAAKAYKLDQIINVDGDDILCSRRAMRAAFETLSRGANYIYTKNLPIGMNVLGYKTGFLNRCMEKYMETEVLETGWGRVFDKSELKEIIFESEPDYDFLRFTLDYPEDYEFFSRVIEALGEHVWDATDGDIIDAARKNDLYKINSVLLEEYRENFNRQVAKEGEQK
jgi:spore coat polysaccharide biosynthesis protein SpsF